MPEIGAVSKVTIVPSFRCPSISGVPVQRLRGACLESLSRHGEGQTSRSSNYLRNCSLDRISYTWNTTDQPRENFTQPRNSRGNLLIILHCGFRMGAAAPNAVSNWRNRRSAHQLPEELPLIHAVFEGFAAIDEYNWNFIVKQPSQFIVAVDIHFLPCKSAPARKLRQAFFYYFAKVTTSARVNHDLPRLLHGLDCSPSRILDASKKWSRNETFNQRVKNLRVTWCPSRLLTFVVLNFTKLVLGSPYPCSPR